MPSWIAFAVGLSVPLAVLLAAILATRDAPARREQLGQGRSVHQGEVGREEWCEDVRASLRARQGFLYPIAADKLDWARWGAAHQYFDVEDLGYAFVARRRREAPLA